MLDYIFMTFFCEFSGPKKDEEPSQGMLYKLFEHLYAPFLLKKWVRAAVMIIFFGMACHSLAVVPKIEIGEFKFFGLAAIYYQKIKYL